MVANVRVLQAFGRENYALSRMDKAQTKYLQRIKLTVLLRATYSPIVEVLGMLSVAVVLVTTSSAISRGQLSGETLLSFLAALMLMYQPLKRLANTSQQMTHAMAGARRVLEILDLQQSIPEPQQALRVQFNREIRFCDLSFAYQTEPVLQEINIALPKGKTLALVGESGSGKSTLGALLLRFWDPSSGRIDVDGHDIRSFRLADWRKCIAYVPQEPVLFSGTVRENVGYGKENASEAEIIAALQAAQAWDFVNEHPQGLERRIGERGAGLSGGQRQRIALARAFISEASVILLDEATSSLDSASEALVQKGLTALLQNRTALVIAHRLRTVVNADYIAVLHKGRVIEYGSHAELIEKKEVYYSFWAAESDLLTARLTQARPADSATPVLPPTLAVES
jgi:subfamily B ATP-binding cassette protein MsbA